MYRKMERVGIKERKCVRCGKLIKLVRTRYGWKAAQPGGTYFLPDATAWTRYAVEDGGVIKGQPIEEWCPGAQYGFRLHAGRCFAIDNYTEEKKVAGS